MLRNLNIRKKLNLLQAYRGIAALLVVMFHLSHLSIERLKQVIFFNVFQAGWSGVDYFFVLSGFIMLYVNRDILGDKHYVKSFLVKRIIRIYPIYWIVTVMVLGFFLLIPSLSAGKNFNIPYIAKSLLLLPQDVIPIIEASWTLNYEIFFYLLFSLGIWLKPKYSFPLLSTWLIVVILRYIKILEFSDGAILNLVFGKLNIEFIFGCLAGYITIKFQRQISKYRWTLFGIANLGYVYLTVFLVTNNIEKMNMDGVSTFGVLSGVLVLSSASIDLNDKLKIPESLIYLGDASYSIYLTHGPLLSAATKILEKMNLEKYFDNIFAPSLLASIAIVIGCIFHSFIEKPLIIILKENISKLN